MTTGPGCEPPSTCGESEKRNSIIYPHSSGRGSWVQGVPARKPGKWRACSPRSPVPGPPNETGCQAQGCRGLLLSGGGKGTTQPCGGLTTTRSFRLSLTTGQRASPKLEHGKGPPCPHPQSFRVLLHPFCGLAWTDAPATNSSKQLKSNVPGTRLEGPARPKGELSGTFSLQSLAGGAENSQEGPRPLLAPLSGGEGPPC